MSGEQFVDDRLLNDGTDSPSDVQGVVIPGDGLRPFRPAEILFHLKTLEMSETIKDKVSAKAIRQLLGTMASTLSGSSCLWSRADDDTDCWETSCGNAYAINEGTPSENSMSFCTFCGKQLTEG